MRYGVTAEFVVSVEQLAGMGVPDMAIARFLLLQSPLGLDAHGTG